MSVFSEAMAAIETAKKAQALANKAFAAAKIEWEKLNEARGMGLNKEKLGQLMTLVKKYAPMVLGMGGGGVALGAVLENSSILSNLFSFLPF